KERGFSCGLWVDPFGQVWSDYVHDTDELVMVVKGDVEFEIDGRVYRSAPGEEIFIPARVRHTVRNRGARRVVLVLWLPPMTTIYTIGHSRHTAERFVELFRAQQISVVSDVRSHSASKWAPQFGKAALAQTFADHAIEYVFFGRELGGRPEGAEFYRS